MAVLRGAILKSILVGLSFRWPVEATHQLVRDAIGEELQNDSRERGVFKYNAFYLTIISEKHVTDLRLAHPSMSIPIGNSFRA